MQVIDPSVTRFFKDVVSQMIGQRENNVAKRYDFMDLLVELKNKGVLENEAGSAQICSDEDVQAAKEIGKLEITTEYAEQEKTLYYLHKIIYRHFVCEYLYRRAFLLYVL